MTECWASSPLTFPSSRWFGSNHSQMWWQQLCVSEGWCGVKEVAAVDRQMDGWMDEWVSLVYNFQRGDKKNQKKNLLQPNKHKNTKMLDILVLKHQHIDTLNSNPTLIFQPPVKMDLMMSKKTYNNVRNRYESNMQTHDDDDGGGDGKKKKGE